MSQPPPKPCRAHIASRVLWCAVIGVGGRSVSHCEPGAPTRLLPCPATGCYAGWMHLGDERIRAAISVGTNPTFEGRSRRVEAYALDREDLDLYGAHAGFSFVDRLRDTLKFDSVDALVAQMTDDVKRCRELLAG